MYSYIAPSNVRCVTVCAEVQREAEGDRRQERVPRAVGQPVPAGHQAAHVRAGAQDRGPRHAGPGPIPLPGTFTRRALALTRALPSVHCSHCSATQTRYKSSTSTSTSTLHRELVQNTLFNVWFQLVHTQVVRVHRIGQRRRRGLQAARQGRAGGHSARGKFHPHLRN